MTDHFQLQKCLLYKISKIQLVVYYKCCVLSLLVAKSAGFLAAKEDESLALTSKTFFILDIFDQLVGFY